jgi:hypothetical protein
VSEPTSAEIRAGLAPLPDTPAGSPDDRPLRDRIARHDQAARIGARDGRDILADELTDRNSAKDAEIARLHAELAEERRKAAELAECAHNVRDLQRIDALTAQNGRLSAESERRGALVTAAAYFAETWAELLESLPDSYDCHLNCPEANAAVEFLTAFGFKTAAGELAKAHAAHDTPEDQHYQGDDDGESETAAILADPETLKAIAEGERQ